MVKKWDIYWVNHDPVIGSEQSGRRPALVISNDIVNNTLPAVSILPLSSFKECNRIYPTEVFLPAEKTGLAKNSVVMIHQVRTVSKLRFDSKCGALQDTSIKEEINCVLRRYFEL